MGESKNKGRQEIHNDDTLRAKMSEYKRKLKQYKYLRLVQFNDFVNGVNIASKRKKAKYKKIVFSCCTLPFYLSS